MAIITTTTTLSAAAQPNDKQLLLASLTNVVNPAPNKSNRTILLIDRELVEVLSILNSSTGLVSVNRGVLGTLSAFHNIGANVWVGHEQDMQPFQDDRGFGLGFYSRMAVEFETINTASIANGVNTTYTSAQILGGLILRNPSAGVTDTLPTATDLINTLRSFTKDAYIGMSFEFTIQNGSGGANTITVAAGTGGTTNGTMTIAQNNMKRFKIVITNVANPAYTVYSLGTVVF